MVIIKCVAVSVRPNIQMIQGIFYARFLPQEGMWISSAVYFIQSFIIIYVCILTHLIMKDTYIKLTYHNSHILSSQFSYSHFNLIPTLMINSPDIRNQDRSSISTRMYRGNNIYAAPQAAPGRLRHNPGVHHSAESFLQPVHDGKLTR